MGRGDKRAAESGRTAACSGGAKSRRLAGGGDANVCSLTHLPDARPAARSTGAARELPLMRDNAAFAAPGPEGREWYRSGQSGYRTQAQGGVHRGHSGRQPRLHLFHQYPTTLPGDSIAPTSARCSRAFARSSPQQRPGFRRQHPAPSLLGLRHLVGGGKNTARMRACSASRSPAKRA